MSYRKWLSRFYVFDLPQKKLKKEKSYRYVISAIFSPLLI